MTLPSLPERIGRLNELAYNLWWSWHEDARQLFRVLDYPLWRNSEHNPVKQLRQESPERLQAAANDPAFLALYDAVMADYDAEMNRSPLSPELSPHPIAYFSMEFALHSSLPIYAGGLGVLAGDICKEASDLALPMVAVGFMYPQGYFHQHISADGWQEEVYQTINFDEAPITRIVSTRGEPAITRLMLGKTPLAVGACLVRVGRTSVYLLDTNLEENPVPQRQLLARLYVADREQRLQQEIVLGVGGVRVLRALGLTPSVWHANEGHTAFMMLERVQEFVAKGLSFAEAVSRVQQTTVFTTHTPVPAGHDTFPIPLVEGYFAGYWESLGIDAQTFLGLGQGGGPEAATVFNMSVLAMRLAGERCAVSELHSKVARRMWHDLWPNLSEDQVPITHVTNGIHVPSWVPSEVFDFLGKHLGTDWMRRHDDPDLWQRVMDIPDEAFWTLHHFLKCRALGTVRELGRSRWLEDNISPVQVLAMGALHNPDTLTIVFARRFTEYKRPTLLFRDVERLRRILNNPWHPVQIIFAGKSHPADFPSKWLLRQVYNQAADPKFQGRIAFVEDYGMHLAHYLSQGADVWLNTPRRLHEASGTSGMKATLSGVLHLSVPDGWWYEGYNGQNGWVIGDGLDSREAEAEDRADAEALYRLLEETIVPLYYDRDQSGIPHGWVRMIKEAMRSIAPVFCTHRMMKDYAARLYKIPALQPGDST